MQISKNEMYKRLFKYTSVTLSIVMGTIIILVAGLHWAYNEPLNGTTPSLILGIIGTVLAFIGGIFSNDAIGRWGATSLPQWRWGNRLQMAGFAFVITAFLFR